MQLKPEVVFSNSNSWMPSGLAMNTVSSIGEQKSFPSSYRGLQDCRMDHRKPGRPEYQTSRTAVRKDF